VKAAPLPVRCVSRLLLLALWSCGRCASIVQAQRQVHRAHLGRPNHRRSSAGVTERPLVDCNFSITRCMGSSPDGLGDVRAALHPG
jgi:hypothetical protein